MSGFAAGTCQTVRSGIGGISVLSLVGTGLTAGAPGHGRATGLLWDGASAE